MSIAASNGVWTRSKARTPAELLVLLAMADWADEDGVCYPSYAGVAKRARLSERQVIRVIAKFVDSGELDKQVGAHRIEARGHRRGKTGLQPRNQYRFSDRILGHQEGVTERGDIHDTAESRGDNDAAKGVTPEAGRGDIYAAHIRNEPLVDPLVDPLEGDAASLPDADGTAEMELSFAQLWNCSTTDPILRCREKLTAQRRRHIRKRLTERPLTEWVDVFQRINASAFCRGDNDRGWVADFAWVIGSPDVAVKVLEGKYDNRPGRERPFTATELAEAKRILTHAWGSCRHEPRCATSSVCVGHIIRQWRRDRGEAA